MSCLLQQDDGVTKYHNREAGVKLQKRANAMFMRGEIGEKYIKLRREAEELLGIWDWQKSVPEWKRVGTTHNRDLYPRMCSIAIQGDPCPHLPAGSPKCKECGCP